MMSKIHDGANVFFTAGGFLSFFRSPVVGFGRNLVEIHRSAPPQLSNRFGEEILTKNPRKLEEKTPQVHPKILYKDSFIL